MDLDLFVLTLVLAFALGALTAATIYTFTLGRKLMWLDDTLTQANQHKSYMETRLTEFETHDTA